MVCTSEANTTSPRTSVDKRHKSEANTTQVVLAIYQFTKIGIFAIVLAHRFLLHAGQRWIEVCSKPS